MKQGPERRGIFRLKSRTQLKNKEIVGALNENVSRLESCYVFQNHIPV